MDFLKKLYANPFFHGLVAAAEGGAIGAVTDAGFDAGQLMTKAGAKHLAIAVVTGVAIAVRNYLKNRPGQPALPAASPQQ